jgi:hypothetical protein
MAYDPMRCYLQEIMVVPRQNSVRINSIVFSMI